MRDSETIMRRAAETLDFAKPIALVMLGVMGHLGDDEDPWSIAPDPFGPPKIVDTYGAVGKSRDSASSRCSPP